MEGGASETHRLRSSPAGRKKSRKLSTNMPEHTVQLKGKNKRGTSEVGYKKIKYIDITQQLISLETSKPSANRHATTDRKSSN